MELRNRLTKRALKDKLFYSELTLKHTRNSLASTQTDLETAHSNLEKAKAKLDKVTALYVAERAKNAELRYDYTYFRDTNDDIFCSRECAELFHGITEEEWSID